MNKEGIEIMSDMNLEIDNQKEKYEKFKKKITNYIYENIMEQLEYDENTTRKEIIYILNEVTDSWEDKLDNFIEEFEEEWDDV